MKPSFAVSASQNVANENSTHISDRMWEIINAPWFGLLVGIIIGLAGLWAAYISYRKARRIISLRYLVADRTIVGPLANPGLEIRFDKKVVERVTSTSFGIWNDGTETILGEHIAKSDRLRLAAADGVKILNVEIVAVSRPSIAANLTSSAAGIDIDFEYLDPTDGFRIEMLHTGSSDSISLAGTVRGIPAGIQRHGPSSKVGWALGIFLLTAAALLIGMIGMFAYVFASLIAIVPWPRKLIYIAVPVMLGLSALWGWFGKKPKKEVESKPRRLSGVPDVITDDSGLTGAALFARPPSSVKASSE